MSLLFATLVSNPNEATDKAVQAMVLAAENSPLDANAYRKDICKASRGFIFLGTPHRGSNLTVAGKICALFGYWGGSSTKLLEVIDRRSDINELLHGRFVECYQRDDKDIVSFYETEPEIVAGFPVMTVSQISTNYCYKLLDTDNIYPSRLWTRTQLR